MSNKVVTFAKTRSDFRDGIQLGIVVKKLRVQNFPGRHAILIHMR
ncbi:hypothetical protein [Rhodopirellula europaea]